MAARTRFPRYAEAEILRFLRAVDAHLDAPAQVVLIGGSAIVLHGGASATNDVDTFGALDARLERAATRARKDTGLEIPLGAASVSDIPYRAEERVERHLPDLKRLRVLVLEPHDLALSKTVRGDAHDLQQLKELHAKKPLSIEVLVDRYLSEMGHAIKGARDLDLNILNLIETLFGELPKIRTERRLAARLTER